MYAKVNLYDDRGLLAATQYFDVHLDPQEEKDFLVKFKGNNIASYDVELIPASEVPDKSNIIDFFGYEFDMTDFFGMDLTNMSIFGVPLKDLLKWDNVKKVQALFYGIFQLDIYLESFHYRIYGLWISP